ncbi:hypothetical protein FHS55_002168 [Angulomicrobium tetraedrale]|uniref:Uncharacterized protein n=1 Tax=Ancylobacter tetraedralis TaxID=217068 RepID=A0A839ZA09_9HYPH|nr:hypothetical protein [Ancylobacter tetraedralis]MBB3771569.1 hypothetical protein [Ancylobacter tetraedralis]
MATPTCRTCIFWQPDVVQPLKGALGNSDGDCRRNSPRLRFPRHSEDAVSSAWPPTAADDWCGEHRPDFQGHLPMEAS